MPQLCIADEYVQMREMMSDKDRETKGGVKAGAQDNLDAPKSYDRPSDRMFRRSRAAEMRRRQAARKDDRFMRLVFGIAGFALLLTFLFFFMYADFAGASEAVAQNEAKNASEPVSVAPLVGNLTLIDIAGVAFVLVSGYAVFRRYKK